MDLVPLVEWLRQHGSTLLVVLVGVSIVLVAARSLISGLRRLTASPAGPGRSNAARLAEAASHRWQLLLLGSTGVVLSLASGYTTWSGMTNFTGESTLSLMVTFGIQGVMLIVAWLIGESFAAGMHRRLPDGRPAGVGDKIVGALLAVCLVSAAFYFVLTHTSAIGWAKDGGLNRTDWSRFADVSAFFALGLIILGVIAFNFSRGGELSLPYVQSTRVIIRNAILWVMFLACMGTSVFFSFDSLFTAIFPKAERARAANLRAQNQVAGIVADIGGTIERRRLEEIDHLFASKGWSEYDGQLDKLFQASQGAEAAIEKFFNDQLEARNRAVKDQQERIATAQSGAAGLQTKKTSLTEELSRLKGERPGLAAELAEKRTELEARAKAVDAKRVDAMAEDRGVEGSGKSGKGPVYRQRMDELAKAQDAYKIQDERTKDVAKRLASADSRIAQVERELAQLDGDLAKLKGETATAEQRIKLTQETGAGDTSVPRIDPARVRPAFERARVDFRQDPGKEGLDLLAQQCSTLRTAVNTIPSKNAELRGIDCDPKAASEAAAVMFGLNAGLKTFEANCAGGGKLAENKTTDELYGFARKCLADSGLPSKETEELRTKINFADLQRDDKAHPFVATLNAFHDGNYLAYLALAIAIAMDGLVFMSGLFGANAVRSPLSDVPSMKPRSGKQLEAIIENALLPDTYENARVVLNALRPITAQDGFTARVVLDPNDPHANEIRRVLNAAATIGAVRHMGGRNEEYLVRSELFEFLSVASRKAFHADEEHGRNAQLNKVVTVALQPYVGDHAEIVLHHCHPISETNGFSAEVFLARMPADDQYVVRKVLNAGATLNYVQRDDRADQDQRFYVHKQLYKTLLLISASYPAMGQRSYAPRIAGPDAKFQPPAIGGDLTPQVPRLPAQTAAESPMLALPANAAARPMHASPSSKQPDGLTDEQIRREYWSELLRALDFDKPDIALWRLNQPEIHANAQAAWNTLVELAGRASSKTLSRLLSEHQTQQNEKLRQCFNELSNEADRAENRVDVLDRVLGEVNECLPALMIFPENGLLAFLVDHIERAAGPDNGLLPEEESIGMRLKSLRQEIADLDLNSVGSWQQMSEWFKNGLVPDGPKFLYLKRDPRRQRS